jgi:hypothetical protein
MASIAIVLFSKDRPLQLDGALRSLAMHCPESLDHRPVVLYATSGSEFEAAYEVLRLQHPRIEFRREADFRIDLLEIIGAATRILFLVDDIVVTGDLPLSLASSHLDESADLLGFSFRLGRNTTYCYVSDEAQALPEFQVLGPSVLGFDWRGAEHDFGYPLEVSATLYRGVDLRPLLGWLSYRNPNTLESELAGVVDGFRHRRPRLACLEQSVVVSVPANVVQDEWRNRAGSDETLRSQDLLTRFERGERLDLAAYRGMVSRSCHQELGFVFTKDPQIPTVSVLVRCHGRASRLQDTVESLTSQSFTDWELVLVDDGWHDEMAEAIGRIREAHPKVRLRVAQDLRPETSGALGRGVRASLGRFVLPLEAGAVMGRATRLQELVSFLDASAGLGFVQAVEERSAEQDGAQASALGSPPSLEREAHTLCLFRRHLWYRVDTDPPVDRAERWAGAPWLALVERAVSGARLSETADPAGGGPAMAPAHEAARDRTSASARATPKTSRYDR